MRSSLLFFAAASTLIASAWAAGCSSSSSDDASSGAGASGAAGGAGSAVSPNASRKLAATKCAYDIKPREEYSQVFFPKTDDDLQAGEVTSADPQITRVRLGLGGKLDSADPAHVDPTTSVAIGWETDVPTTATTVRWGKAPDPGGWAAGDVVDGLSYVVAPPAGASMPFDQRVHEAHLCGLEPDTTYYYRVGGGPSGKEVWSDVRSFRTLPSSPDAALVVGVTGDSRGELNNAWQLLQERLYKRGDVQLQLFSGDMINLPSLQSEFVSWLAHLERDTQSKPSVGGQILTLVAMGNHENYQSQYFASVVQPQDDAKYPGFGELFFSFDAGPAHFVVMDDFSLAGTAKPDLKAAVSAWLEADLTAAEARRGDRPWIIVSHHHGEWSSGKHGTEKDSINVRNALVPMWDKHKVDLVLDGHDHLYERSKPLTMGADGKPVVGSGTTYIICAGSGADGYGAGTTETTEKSLEFEKEGGIGVYGVLKLTKSKLDFEAHLLTAAGDDPVKDTLSLTK